MTFIRQDILSRVLQQTHASFMDSTAIFKRALVDARDSHYSTVVQKESGVPNRTQVSVSKFEVGSNNLITIWVEFSISRSDGVLVGTHVYEFGIGGEDVFLKETYGTIFVFEIPVKN
jgi:hypothetical protein